jgi:hypothetical protein
MMITEIAAAAAGDDDDDHLHAGTGKTTMLARGGSTMISPLWCCRYRRRPLYAGACGLEIYAALELMLKWAFGEPAWVRTAEYPMASAAAISMPFATWSPIDRSASCFSP